MRLAIGILLIGCSTIWSCSQPKTVELSFEHGESGLDADEQTLHSIQKVGKMYIVTYHGDYEERLEWLNEYHVTESSRLDNKRNCSLFTACTGRKNLFLGRNFDRLSETPVLGKFSPTGKFSSFAFSPGSEVYINGVVGNANPTVEQKNHFLYCLPFYATDGINEKGLSIAIAGAPSRRINHSEQREPMFVLLFIRHILDNFKDVDEVAQFAESVSLYDSALGTISHHFIVVDASGQWLIIDYPEGNLRLKRGQGGSQARTNHFLEGGPAIDNTSFWRYDKLNKALSLPNSIASDREAMDLLRQVRHDTQWSVVYNPKFSQGLVAIQENYLTQYRFGF